MSTDSQTNPHDPHVADGRRGGSKEVAAALGVHPGSVPRLAKQGRIGSKGFDGKWNLELVRREYQERKGKPGRPRAGADPDAPDYNEANARDKMASAQMRELRLRERTGELVERAEVRKLLVDIAKTLAGQLDSLEDEMVPELAATNDEHETRTTLRHGLNRARRTVADAVQRYQGHDGTPDGRAAYRAWLEREIQELDDELS